MMALSQSQGPKASQTKRKRMFGLPRKLSEENFYWNQDLLDCSLKVQTIGQNQTQSPPRTPKRKQHKGKPKKLERKTSKYLRKPI